MKLLICGVAALLLLACDSDDPAARANEDASSSASTPPDAASATRADSGTRPMDAASDAFAPRPLGDATADSKPDSKPDATSDASSAALDASGPAPQDASQAADAALSLPEAAVDASAPAADAGDAAVASRPLRSFVYVGGWDWSGNSYPFRTYAMDRQTGALTAVGGAVDLGANPSYVVPGPDRRVLYVANEFAGKAGVSVAALDRATGAPSLLQRRALDGDGTVVFTSVDPGGRFVLGANINAGKLAVYRIEAEGRLSAAVDTESFAASAETHSVVVHPAGTSAFAPNKGLDEIAQFRFDSSTGQLTANSAGPFESEHDGPRHIAFAPNGRFAYVTYEGSNVLGAYQVGSDGTLQELEALSTLPSTYQGANRAAHVLVHPNGRYVYVSNRGHDSLAVFAIADDGRLSLRQHVASGGKTPRHFDLDALGELLVVANQGDEDASNGTLAVFSLGSDGRLSALAVPVTGLKSPTTACIVSWTDQ
jgi:6-phosphogluconolactonase